MSTSLFPELNRFLTDLAANNHKAWFDEHREHYHVLRVAFLRFVDELIQSSASHDPQLIGQEAKNSVFRINRDVRFSQNKAPYKTNFSAYLSKEGKKFPGAGYYFHFQPDASFLAAGIWMPEASLLRSIRQEIDYNYETFKAICQRLEHCGFKSEADRLSRPPKGYEADNPAIHWLKLKSFVMVKPFDMVQNPNPKALLQLLSQSVNELRPYVYFLNQSLPQDL